MTHSPTNDMAGRSTTSSQYARHMTALADVGLIGLAVMGQNLALNMADHGHRVAVYNRTAERTQAFVDDLTDVDIVGTDTIEALVAMVSRPRRLVLMVKAGAAVDAVIDDLVPHLDPGDVVIDGGNSHYEDTARRVDLLAESGIHFVGAGVSGGEVGARHGPSIMPGGAPEAWPLIQDLLQAIAAHLGDGTPCCDWLGPAGSGHYVKMVHNGIEYGDIQLLAEAYDLMRRSFGMQQSEIAEVLAQWNTGRLESYLVEISAAVMREHDAEGPLLERILDAAGQKGTGRWTVETALTHGLPLTMIAEAVFARGVSALKDDRVAAAALIEGPSPVAPADRTEALNDLEAAVYASKLVSYSQGFMLLASASDQLRWELDLARIARLWREGCIIRAAFLDDIASVFDADPPPGSLLLAPGFRDEIAAAQVGWRRTVRRAVEAGIPVPATGSALAFFDSYRTDRLPANLIQALRDYFGAHTYERVDRPRGEWFHTDWADTGGRISSGSYDA